jgi:hypothetical protein
MKTLSLQPRDENYGSVAAASAFRVYQEYNSETERTKLERIFRKAGYAFNWSRCSWIATKADAWSRVVELCADAGYNVPQ